MRIFLSGSFKLCGDIFDHLEDTFKYVGEVVRMDRFWASQILYDTTNWSKDKFWEIDCICLSNCDVVIFCGDWEKHEGCRREYERAKTEGKTILYAENASPAPICKDTLEAAGMNLSDAVRAILDSDMWSSDKKKAISAVSSKNLDGAQYAAICNVASSDIMWSNDRRDAIIGIANGMEEEHDIC